MKIEKSDTVQKARDQVRHLKRILNDESTFNEFNATECDAIVYNLNRAIEGELREPSELME